MHTKGLTLFVLALSLVCGHTTELLFQNDSDFPQSSLGAWTSTRADDGSGFRTYDDFRLNSPSAITRVRWIGFYWDYVQHGNNPVNTQTRSWEFGFYADSSGSPSSTLLLLSVSATNVIDQIIGTTNFSGDTVQIHSFTADLPMPVYIPDTNSYWFSVLSSQPSFNPIFTWTSSSVSPGDSFQATLPSGSTWVRTANRAFSLEGDRNPLGIPAYISADLETIRLNRHMPGLSAMAVKSGRIVALGAAGYRRQGQSTPLLITDTINIASCTKWMTATIAGRLVDRGLIGWNTRVRDLFSNYATFNSSFYNATLDQLLAHRAGVQQGSTFENNHWSQLMAQNGTIPQIRRWVSETVLKDPPEVTPGTYLYSNQGYTVVATMLELASGKDWETLIQQEIFTPIRMKSATLGIVYDDSLPPKAPVGHDLGSGQTVPVPRVAMDSATGYRYQASNGSGGYTACTLQDWTKFLHMHMTSDISDYLSPATASRLQLPFTGTEGYGRGIDVENRSWATPGQALDHSGDIWGEDTVTWMAPARDFIVVVFANCRSADATTALALDDVAGLLVSRYSGATPTGPWLETPTILPPRRIANNIACDYLTLPGVSYQVQASSNLVNWSPANGLGGQVATSLQSSYTNTFPGPQNFFRIKILP